ncbi:MAG: chitobiase/beta-hexosaminidase C-terminal domain-containing protein [Clostridia bacterium]|nr:chitobiase/beta-hexosaminidase C-terminal domain-containing protein [Clostridia bacterium]
MVCKQCGRVLKDDALICEFCGKENSVSPHIAGVQGHRQGRKNGTASDVQLPGAGQMYAQPAPRENADVRTPELFVGASRQRKDETEKQTYRVRKVMINWVRVAIVLAALAVMAVIGAFAYLNYTDGGQVIMARMGKDANAQALWIYGQELLDQGYVDKAIETFERAYEKDPELDNMYAHLQQLADAYEAGGYIGKAEEVYKLMTEVEPARMSAYRSLIRIMEAQDRKMELAAFYVVAYENTGEKDFLRQREELLPSTPTTSVEAGSLMFERDIALLSKEDYEIYYILGEEGILPEDGQRYESAIHLTEGSHVLRAVAVSNDLVSDEMVVKYNITLPRPTAPYPSLAPGTYEQRQRVRLKYLEGEDDKRSDAKPEQKEITMYYTLDGQTPTSNSPIYQGEGILLPPGRSMLKAISVNGFGKVSNVLEREYKIQSGKIVPFFRSGDEMADVTILKTSRDAFVKKYGQPKEETEIEDNTVRGVVLKATYNWGEARFVMVADGYVLYYLNTSNSAMVGPRKTRIGDEEEKVTAQFRDVGQPKDQNGDRSLYWNYDNNGKDKGKVYHLDDTHDRIDYSYVRQEDGATVTLSYELENGKVQRISMRYRLQ